MYYIGLDVHKRIISYCVKDSIARIHSEGSLPATRFDLDRWMDENVAASVVCGNGSHYVHWQDLRSPEAARRDAEGGTPLDVAGHRGREEEERPHRRQQDLRLPALRLPAGVLHGHDRHSRTAAHAAVPQPAGPADGADEKRMPWSCFGVFARPNLRLSFLGL